MTNRFKPATPEELLRRGVGAPAKPKAVPEKPAPIRRTTTKAKD